MGYFPSALRSRVRSPRSAAGLLLLFLFAVGAPAGAHVFWTTGELNTRAPRTLFRCGDPIYLVALWQGLAPGRHRLTVAWIDPWGGETDRTLDVSGEDRNAWVALQPPSVRGVERLYGGASSDHGAGAWTVRVEFDGRLYATQHFSVQC